LDGTAFGVREVMGMFGDKRMEMPGTVGEAWAILKQFGIKYNGTDFIFENACRLVELNNQVFDNYMRL
jgi:hypothetical protein